MKKPSKFSSRYTRNRRGRKVKRTAIIAGSVLGLMLLFFLPYLFGKVSEYRENGNFGQVVRPTTRVTGATDTRGGEATKPPVTTRAPATQAPATETTQPATTPSTQPETTTPSTQPDNLQAAGYSLSSGTDIRILFVPQEDGSVIYTGAEGGEGEYTWDLSPNKDQILINETEEQNLIIIGSDLVAEDHSFNTFNHEDRGRLAREDYIGGDFVWMRNARFFTEDIILFESQVSNEWEREYLRYYDQDQEIYRLIPGTWARSARLVEETVGGYLAELDGRQVIITPELEVAE